MSTPLLSTPKIGDKLTEKLRSEEKKFNGQYVKVERRKSTDLVNLWQDNSIEGAVKDFEESSIEGRMARSRCEKMLK